jgi:hypothetical protein
MSTSNSTNYNVTRDDIISESLQICGVLEEGGTPSANQLSDCSRTLNMMIKNWMTDGLQLWLNEEIVIFPTKNQQTVTFAVAGGDRMALSSGVVTTKLNGTHANNATVITVDSSTGMTAADVVGVVTDTAGITWTTIASVDSATQITLNAGIGAAASDNDRVYTYTTVFAQKIAKINNAWVRGTDEIDIPVEFVSRQEYTYLSSKDTSGRINQLYFDPQFLTSVANVWPVPDDSHTNDRLYAYVTRYVGDFDGATDDADYPQEWYLTLAWGLAMFVAVKYGVSGQRYQEIVQMASMLHQKAAEWDVEQTSIFITPSTMWTGYTS